VSQVAGALDPTAPNGLHPIMDVGRDFGLEESEIISYGPYKAKISLDALKRLTARPDGQLVVVTAITPTRAGEGKTTSAISLVQGLGKIGANVALCLRQPSTGPLFGIKGGGTGGGMAQVVPMEEINLHFNGDIHAVEAAHNLLAAVIDAAIFHDQLQAGPSFITWPRTLDVNDRALRHIVSGLGGVEHGVPRESSFIIAAASELMAILALAKDLPDLRAPDWPHHRHPAQGRQLRHGRRPARRRRHDGPDERGVAAESRANDGGPAGHRARRALRQHRARQQLIVGRSDRPQARRHRGDGGGIRR